MVDPKQVEFAAYANLGEYLFGVTVFLRYPVH